MRNESDYSRDIEFSKLLERHTQIDLTTAALELARDAYPDLDFVATHDWVTERANEISSRALRASSDEDALQVLTDCLGGRCGLKGEVEDYERADSSYLHRVIVTRRGLPISLSVLYMAVANRAGLPLFGVAAPGHFLTRHEAVSGSLFIDAFAGGEILTLDQVLLRLTLSSTMSEDHAMAVLEPTDSRTIIIRMLNNLKALYAEKQNWHAAWKVQHRLTALQPGSYEERRDLGLLSVKADRPGVAIDLLEACLKTAPKKEAQALETHLAEAHRQICHWN